MASKKPPLKTTRKTKTESTVTTPIVDTPVINAGLKRTYICMILDRSSSMGADWPRTMAAVREQIATAKAQVSPTHKVFLAVIFFNEKVSGAVFKEVTSEYSGYEYLCLTPSGSTALYDAMDYGITITQQALSGMGPEDAALIITITDGEENSSRIKNPSGIKMRIAALEETGRYTFTYVGTEDAFKVNEMFGINVGNTIKYSDAATVGFSNTKGLNSYFSARAAGATMSSNFYSDTKGIDQVWDKDTLTKMSGAAPSVNLDALKIKTSS